MSDESNKPLGNIPAQKVLAGSSLMPESCPTTTQTCEEKSTYRNDSLPTSIPSQALVRPARAQTCEADKTMKTKLNDGSPSVPWVPRYVTLLNTSNQVPVVASVLGSAPPGSAVIKTLIGKVVGSVGQPPRFNSIMVLDPSQTALPIHAVVPAEGGATGTTYIAADGSLLPVALPVSAASVVQASSQGGPHPSQNTPAASQASSQPSSQDPSQAAHTATQIGTQVGSVVSQAVTSSSTGHLSMIQMVPTPVHIQVHPQANPISHSQIHHSGSQTVTTSNLPLHASLSSHQSSQTPSSHLKSVKMSHQMVSHPVSMSHAQHHVQANTQGLISRSSCYPSPLITQKKLTPILQSTGLSGISSIQTSHSSLIALSSPPSPHKQRDSEKLQSSGSTTISATSSPGQESPSTRRKPPPSAASITAGLHAAGLHGTEMIPYKKLCKEQPNGNGPQKRKIGVTKIEFRVESFGNNIAHYQLPQKKQQLHEQAALQGSPLPLPLAPRVVTLKLPRVSLLSSYQYSWESCSNHFLKHSDVRPKDEKRPSLCELASQPRIFQHLNGWKVHHLTTQMDELVDVESKVTSQLESMLSLFERETEKTGDKDVTRVKELIKGNLQRSRVIADQLTEAKANVMKIFDHKPHVAAIIHRSSGKRTYRKRKNS